MSILSLTSQDTVVVQSLTATTGAAMGVAEAWADGATVDCLVQTVDAQESLAYSDRGMKFTHEVFFSSDPALTNAHRLKWKTTHFLRVLSLYVEGRPGTDLLWVARCSEETTRRES